MTVGVLYEHPEWFKPLFAALDRRGLRWTAVDAASLRWDPTARPAFDLLVNRMSPSAWTRGHAHAIQSTLGYLHYVARWGIPVINGLDAWRLEISKSAQLDLFEQLDVPYPRARVINHPGQAVVAADGLRYPIVVKPNIGGSGAGIVRFDSREALEAAVSAGSVSLGLDDTALVQEFLAAEGGHITRLEVLQHQLLYAIEITPPRDHGFNLCPADICQADNPQSTIGNQQSLDVCPARPAMQIAATSAPADVVRLALAISRHAGLDVCGIEYLVDARDGRPYFYDVNALSNFVTDAVQVVGFDPFERFVDVIEARLAAAVPAGHGNTENTEITQRI
jgi:glutathione synthase/RimK-type ligase-like ATP-grasp enzyme